MRKKVLLIIALILTAFVISILVVLLTNDYLFIGNVWYDTPEKALLQEADNTIDSEQSLTIAHLLETRDINDITIMTFVSISDTLVTVTFVKNEKDQYSVYGYTEEVFLDQPTEFLLNGDPNQFILFPYHKYDDTVFGWCYTDIAFTVNEMIPMKKTFEFTCQGKKQSIDFWWIDSIATDLNIQIEYMN